MLVDLDRIAATKRRSDEAIADAFAAEHPRILGGLLDVLADTLAELPHTSVSTLPRMADFARVLDAVDQVRGTAARGTAALKTYLGQAERVAAEVVEGDQVATAIRTKVEADGAWTGTAGELHAILTPDRAPAGWPRTARGMSAALKRAAPSLRNLGITVAYRREADRRLWALATEGGGKGPSRTSDRHDAGPDQQERRDGCRDDHDGSTGATVTDTQVPDQQERPPRDGRDGRDGCVPLTLDDVPTGGDGPGHRCAECDTRSDSPDLLHGLCPPCRLGHYNHGDYDLPAIDHGSSNREDREP